jgi:hypothetical protein
MRDMAACSMERIWPTCLGVHTTSTNHVHRKVTLTKTNTNLKSRNLASEHHNMKVHSAAASCLHANTPLHPHPKTTLRLPSN